MHSGDLLVVEAGCLAYNRLRALQEELMAALMIGEDGRPAPGLRASESVSATITKLSAQLLLAPATRSRLPAKQRNGPSNAPDELSELLGDAPPN